MRNRIGTFFECNQTKKIKWIILNIYYDISTIFHCNLLLYYVFVALTSIYKFLLFQLRLASNGGQTKLRGCFIFESLQVFPQLIVDFLNPKHLIPGHVRAHWVLVPADPPNGNFPIIPRIESGLLTQKRIVGPWNLTPVVEVRRV
jgi:hypothetical protein